ncbi:MAG: HTH domain-containing protein [Deltaproteobacteria bacterium]|nr:HTH domain-containing protein [Deltaproteobacteria bacterium]
MLRKSIRRIERAIETIGIDSTGRELAKEAGVSLATVRRYIRAMHNHDKPVHNETAIELVVPLGTSIKLSIRGA